MKKKKWTFYRLIHGSISDAEAKGTLFSWLGHKIDLHLKMFHIIALYFQTPKRGSFENQSSLTNVYDKAITNGQGSAPRGMLITVFSEHPKALSRPLSLSLLTVNF